MPHGENLSFGVPIVTRDVFNFMDALDMTLQIESWSNAARLVQVRGFTRHGFISIDHTTNADRSRATASGMLQDFPLEFQVSSTSTSVRRGDLFVRVTLQMGGFNVGCLVSGYVTDSEFPCYPMDKPSNSVDGRGKIRAVLGTDPAAGIEISETVPTNVRWRLLGVRFVFVASATATTRTIVLVLDDGTNVIGEFLAPSQPTANQIHDISCFPIGAPVTVLTNQAEALFPSDITLMQGSRILTETTNLQVGDNFGAPVMFVEEWIEE